MEHYFVALIHPTLGTPVLVSEPNDDAAQFDVPVMYESEGAAHHAMKNSSAATAWGYEVLPWDHFNKRSV